jgi:hypothetical protein
LLARLWFLINLTLARAYTQFAHETCLGCGDRTPSAGNTNEFLAELIRSNAYNNFELWQNSPRMWRFGGRFGVLHHDWANSTESAKGSKGEKILLTHQSIVRLVRLMSNERDGDGA